ncbi:K(+)/H(+) antiporter [Blyttiomyces sp. JEL0837]|nr:K(+)/H(+) antiporter [Blyttiomyces sp. JEL0837]
MGETLAHLASRMVDMMTNSFINALSQPSTQEETIMLYARSDGGSSPTPPKNGTNTTAAAPDSGSILAGSNPLHDAVGLFIIQALIIIATARLFYIPVAYFKQPRVIAEVISGIILGSSALSRIPAFKNNIFPDTSLSSLDLVAQFGLVFFLFLVGMELDPVFFIRNVKKSVAIAISSAVLPFLAAIGGATLLYNSFAVSGTSFGALVVFVGAVMSITTFPDVARILTERKLHNTPLGQIALSSAAIDDVGSWAFLLFVIALVNNTGQPLAALWIFLVMVGYTAFLWFVVRPYLAHWADLSESSDSVSQLFVLIVLTMVLSSAFFTQAIGAHAMFGGFLIGVIVPHNHSFAINLLEKLEDLINIFFLPLYFVYSGFNTRIDLLDDGTAWGLVFLLVAIGCLGKIVGAGAAARFINGMSWRESLALGVLMNTKGLLEFIILNLGYQSQIISPEVFSILVVTVLISNVLTVPLISLVYPPSIYEHPPAQQKPDDEFDRAEKASPESHDLTACSSLNLLCYLPGMQTVPAMMAFTELLRTSELPMSVKALRLIRLSDRNSTIMIATDTDATLRTDPVMNVFRAYGHLNHIGVSSTLAVSVIEEFPDQIVSAAKDSNLIILPWQEAVGNQMGHGGHGHGGLGHGGAGAGAGPSNLDHAAVDEGLRNSLIESVHRRAPCSVAVFLDRGFGTVLLESDTQPVPVSPKSGNAGKPTTTRIFLPFFGGRDDREAMQLLLLLAKANVDIHVLRVVAPVAGISHEDSGTNDPNSITIDQPTPATATNDKSDSTHTFAIGNSSTNLSPQDSDTDAGFLIAAKALLKERHPEATWEEVVSGAPVAVVSAKAAEVAGEGKDLVLIGAAAYAVPAMATWVDRNMKASVITMQGHGDVSISKKSEK